MDWFSQTEDLATEALKRALRGEDVSKHPLLAAGYSSIRENGYYNIQPHGKDPERVSGWKFHLSIEPEKIAQAWNIIAPDIMNEKVFAKVRESSKHNTIGNENDKQRGKAIVLYSEDGKDLAPLLRKIEQKLTDAGIKPSQSVIGDNKLKGSSFIYYRNDQDIDGNYIAANRVRHLPAEQAYNLSGKIDPYKNLDVSPARQADKPNPLASVQMTATENKGTYISVAGMKPEELDRIKESLSKNGIEFTAKKSTVLNGDVLAISNADAAKISALQTANSQTPQTSSQPAQTPTSTTTTASTATRQPLPTDVKQHMDAAASVAREQLANPAYKPVPTEQKPATKVEIKKVDIGLTQLEHEALNGAGGGRGNTPKATGALNNVGAHAGKAQLAVQATAQVVDGNYTGAAKTVAQTVATNAAVGKVAEKSAELLARQGLKSAGLMVGVGATLAFGATAVQAKAARGERGAAATEAVAVGLEAVGNILPSGLGGSVLREAWRAAVVHTVGEKYAPEKSGIRQAAELARSVGDKVVTEARYKSMDQGALAKAIQADNVLSDTVKIGGKDVLLSKALEDKPFRETFIKNLEAAQTKGADLQTQIAMVKAFDEKLQTPTTPPRVVAASSPSLSSNPAMHT